MVVMLSKTAGLEVKVAAEGRRGSLGNPSPPPDPCCVPKGDPLPSFSVQRAVADRSTPSVRLPTQLLDMVAEAMISPADEVTRGAVAARLVREIHDSLAWLHPDPSHPERASFQRVVAEVEAHQVRLENPPRLLPDRIQVAR